MEQRCVLSVTLNGISGPDGSGVFDIPAGKDLYVPLISSDGNGSVSYSVQTTGGVTATVLPTTDPTLDINVSGTTAGGVSFSGDMTFSLFSTIAPQTVKGIESLVANNVYTDATFYRAVSSTGFQIIQGGVGSKASSEPNIPDEFNVAGTFNSSGLLAMANAGPGTASSEFFVTADIPLDQDPLELNGGYTVFGQLLTGQAIYNDIENAPASSQYLNSPVTINYAKIISSPDAVLQISEPNTFTGGANISVTATGSDGTTALQSFNVDAIAPTTASTTTGMGTGGPVVLAPFNNNQTTSENVATSGIPLSVSENFSGGSPTFSVTTSTPTNLAPTNVTASYTGSGDQRTLTLTPGTDWVGDFDLAVHVDDDIPESTPFPVHDALPLDLEVPGQAGLNVTTTDSVRRIQLPQRNRFGGCRAIDHLHGHDLQYRHYQCHRRRDF